VSISASDGAAPLLAVTGLSAYYGDLRTLYDVSLSVEHGEILSIVGANGAGKSTLLKAIVGMMNRGAAAHIRGEIVFAGRRVDGLSTDEIVDMGITMVPEGRRLFARMSVEDNLLAGAFPSRCRPAARRKLDEVYGLFPQLRDRRDHIASHISGGEQQMVAIGRALMSSPRLVLFDELSLGLAPVMVDEIYRHVRAVHRNDLACIIIEQDVQRAVGIADHVSVMREGRVVLEGRPSGLTQSSVTTAYFGAGSGSRR
jgi:branched-chain amino acid transport system ATP-binding protein